MPDIVSVHYLQENKMKVKLNSNIRPNILSEIMILRENGGCGESLAQISNFHIYMGIAAQCNDASPTWDWGSQGESVSVQGQSMARIGVKMFQMSS